MCHEATQKTGNSVPEILVRDKRILELDRIVTEVKQSEEWEAVKMNILEIGLEKGREEGRQEGRQEGQAEGRLNTLAALVRDGLISIEEAAKRAEMTVEEFKEEINYEADDECGY